MKSLFKGMSMLRMITPNVGHAISKLEEGHILKSGTSSRPGPYLIHFTFLPGITGS